MTSATPASALTPARADQPPAALLELAADTGASLAYTAAAGWHLLPDPELVRQVQALDRRETRRKTPPPLPRWSPRSSSRSQPHPTCRRWPRWATGSTP
jgi:hypothetical protein